MEVEVPRTVRHLTCQTTTYLPPTIIVTIHRDPDLVGNSVMCTFCERPVPLAECEWAETGVNLQSYLDHLREGSTDDWTDTREWPDETDELPPKPS